MDRKPAIYQALSAFVIKEQRPHNPLVLGSNPSGPTKPPVNSHASSPPCQEPRGARRISGLAAQRGAPLSARGSALKSEIKPRMEYAMRESAQIRLSLRPFPARQLRDLPD